MYKVSSFRHPPHLVSKHLRLLLVCDSIFAEDFPQKKKRSLGYIATPTKLVGLLYKSPSRPLKTFTFAAAAEKHCGVLMRLR